MHPFPTDHITICALMRLFLADREKQFSTAKLTFDIKNPDDKSKKLFQEIFEKGISPFSFTLMGTSNNPFASSFDIPTYFYANVSDDIKIPIERIQMGAISIGKQTYAVFVNDKKYYNDVTLNEHKNKLSSGQESSTLKSNHYLEISSATANLPYQKLVHVFYSKAFQRQEHFGIL